MNPLLSMQEVARETGISHELVRKVLERHKFFSYKTKIVQDFGAHGCDGRIEFFELFTNLINAESATIKTIFLRINILSLGIGRSISKILVI